MFVRMNSTLGIISASYYQDEFGCIKLVIHPETSCNEAESSGDESAHLDSTSSDGDGSKESNEFVVEILIFLV